ncbi:MAG: TraR/DksA C4-type zinc finger protein [Acidimicrobiia bacterium]|nr:TraR/DksA C4-type zinc finger protein [Acidimicrobiia bacterium]
MDSATATRRLAEERTRLERLRDGLHHDGIGAPFSEGLSELSAAGQHQADVATETFDTEAGTTILTDVEFELAEVAQAERRLAEGTYGRCMECGEPIPDERLDAVPATRYCVRHEERWEITGGVRAAALANARGLDGGFLAHDDDRDPAGPGDGDGGDTDDDDDGGGGRSPEVAALHVDTGPVEPGWRVAGSDDDPDDLDPDDGNSGAAVDR